MNCFQYFTMQLKYFYKTPVECNEDNSIDYLVDNNGLEKQPLVRWGYL
jgi:hypothetical protein